MEYNNKIMKIKAISYKTNGLMFEEDNNDLNKPVWHGIEPTKLPLIKKFFSDLNKGNNVEVNFNKDGKIIFLRLSDSHVARNDNLTEEDYPQEEEVSDKPNKANDYGKGARFGMCCNQAQLHLIHITKIELKDMDSFWGIYNTLIKKYHDEAEKAWNEIHGKENAL